ncbi:M56 family metallopeptidase, partial [Candidatus Sumerlaeota bacterium]|nr:M56 family metallopeptidase [Candidatus Sumerlaeota bacterium]
MESILHYLVGISVGWDLLFKGSVILFLCWIFHFSLRRLHPLWRILVFRVGVSALALLPLYASVLPEIPLPLLTKSDSFIEHAPARFSPQTVISDEASQSDTSPYSDSHPAKGNMGTLLIILWFVITAILFTRLLFSYKAIRKIMNNAAAAPETVQSTLRSVQEQLRVKETIQARFSEEVSIPFIATCGARTIVLPRRMVEPDFSGELPGVLAHEVSHLIYHDIFWLTFMDILSRLLWFHPLFWKIPSVHAGDCEESTDIIASQCLGDVTLYSGTLARAALDLLTKTPIPARGAIPMARMPEIRSRLQKLKRSFYFSAIRKKSQIICVVLSAFCLLVLSSIKITYADSGKQDAMPKDPQKYTEKEIRQKSADFFFERIG